MEIGQVADAGHVLGEVVDGERTLQRQVVQIVVEADRDVAAHRRLLQFLMAGAGVRCRAVHDALDRAESDARSVVITGRQGKFSAGFDLATMTESTESMRELVTAGAQMLMRLYGFGLPTVAACTGHALGRRRARAPVLRPADRRRGPGQDRPQRGRHRDGPPDLRGRARPRPAPARAAHPRPHGGAHLRPRGRGRRRLPRHRRAGVRPPHDGAGRGQGARRAPHGRLRADEVDDPRRGDRADPRHARRRHVVHDRTGEPDSTVRGGRAPRRGRR